MHITKNLWESSWKEKQAQALYGESLCTLWDAAVQQYRVPRSLGYVAVLVEGHLEVSQVLSKSIGLYDRDSTTVVRRHQEGVRVLGDFFGRGFSFNSKQVPS